MAADDWAKELEADKLVNKYALDEELEQQPGLYEKWATRHAEARMASELASLELKVVVAEMDAAIRNDPDAYGLPKATDVVVANGIPGTAEYQAAAKALAKARFRERIVEGAVVAMEHRKRSITLLVELHQRGYYADPAPRQPAGVRAGGRRARRHDEE